VAFCDGPELHCTPQAVPERQRLAADAIVHGIGNLGRGALEDGPAILSREPQARWDWKWCTGFGLFGRLLAIADLIRDRLQLAERSRNARFSSGSIQPPSSS